MEFTKEVVFLGLSVNEMDGREGKVTYYSAQFFDQQTQTAFSVTMGEKSGNVDAIRELFPFESLKATFKIVPRDRLWKLALVSINA